VFCLKNIATGLGMEITRIRQRIII
jgi:hypothetical protein